MELVVFDKRILCFVEYLRARHTGIDLPLCIKVMPML